MAIGALSLAVNARALRSNPLRHRSAALIAFSSV